MFLERGFAFAHEAVRDWEERFAPLIAEQLRIKRRGQAGPSWYVDETCVTIKGKWCYLYRAIDRDGNLSLPHFCRKGKASDILVLQEGKDHAESPKDVYRRV